MKETHVPILLLAAFSAALFLTNIWGYDLWPPDEPRFAEVAREMIDSADYVVLRVNGQPYKEKPPLFMWAVAAASLPFGDVNEFSARVPSAIAGVITVLLTYLLAARLHGRRVGLWSALVLTTTMLFWWQARRAQIDMVLTACTTGALYSFWRGHEERRTRWLVCFYACIALAVYAKGPIGYLLAVFLVAAFYWRRKQDRWPIRLLPGTLIVTALILLWLIPARMGASAQTGEVAGEAMAANLFRQTLGRFLFGVSKAQPPWYYLTRLPMGLLPWTLFLPWTLPWVWRRRREGLEMRLLLSWTVPAFIFFTICVGKRELYLLPLYPVIAILIARSVLDLMDGERATWRRRTAMTWAGFLIACGAAPFALLYTEHREIWSRDFLLFSLPAFGFAADTLHRAIRTDCKSLHASVTSHFAGLALLSVIFVFPVIDHVKSAKTFCEPVRRLSEAGVDYDLYSLGFSREEYILYSKHFHTPVFTDLLDLNVPEASDPRKMAKLQRDMQKAVVKAVSKPEVRSFAPISDEDYEALRAAAMSELDLEDPLHVEFKRALMELADDFAASFEQNRPAFFFVDEDNWRWIMSLHQSMRHYTVLNHAGVGSRDVLLIANQAGATLVSDKAR